MTLQSGLCLLWNVTFQLNPVSFTRVIMPHLNRCFWDLLSPNFSSVVCGSLWVITASPGFNDWQILCARSLIGIQVIFYIPDEDGMIYSIADSWVAATWLLRKGCSELHDVRVHEARHTQGQRHRLHHPAGHSELSGPTSEVWCVKGGHLVLPGWWAKGHVPLQPGRQMPFYSSLPSLMCLCVTTWSGPIVSCSQEPWR